MNYTYHEKINASERASFTELIENQEGIILDLDSLHYYSLNAAGIFLWKQLRQQSVSTWQSLSQALTSAFDLEASRAEADVQGFLQELKLNNLISFTAISVAETPVAASSAATIKLPGYAAPELKASYSLSQVALSGSTTVATSALTGS